VSDGVEDMEITGEIVFSGGIADPTSYECSILSYSISLGRMLVQVDKKGTWRGPETFYLIFPGVIYFEGPTRWGSVDFSVGSGDECLRLLQNTEQVDFGMSRKALLEYHRLFQAKTPKGTVKILGVPSVSVSKEIPADFRYSPYPSQDETE
jgi:hypothetical protein